MQGSIYIKSSTKASHMFSGTSLGVMLQYLWLSLAAGLSPHGPMEPVSQVSSIRYSRDVVSYPTTTCQRMSTLGADYEGQSSITNGGKVCQRWSATEPHDHEDTSMGDHNYCRNPDGGSGVWCNTMDPLEEWDYCPVPWCSGAMLKVLDFSADNDNDADSSGVFTHATLERTSLPHDFTLCNSIMVDAWPPLTVTTSMVFWLKGDEVDDLRPWMYLKFNAATHETEFTISVSFVKFEAVKQSAKMFPKQWVRACMSLDSASRSEKSAHNFSKDLLNEINFKSKMA